MSLEYRLVFGSLRDAYQFVCATRGQIMAADQALNSRVAQVATWLVKAETRAGLMLLGGVGSGKTTMAEAVCEMMTAFRENAQEYSDSNFLDRRGKEAERAEIENLLSIPRVKMATAQDLTKMATADEEGFKAYKNAPVLIIDDLGCEPAAIKSYGTELTPIIDILTHRYDTLSRTIVTTNLDLAGIQRQYGIRIADRCKEFFDRIAFTNSSYR